MQSGIKYMPVRMQMVHMWMARMVQVQMARV